MAFALHACARDVFSCLYDGLFLMSNNLVSIILLYFKRRQWTDDAVSIDDHGKFQAETQRCMKEKLFKEIIELFDKGQVK